jgi:phosphoribosyl 1,2-cyclic phosphodiesterase
MMDCGFGIGETTERLGRAGLDPSDLAAIVVTHEHGDHLGGVAAFAAKHSIPVHLTRGTWEFLPEDFPAELIRLVDSHNPFPVQDIRVEPFPVPHDAREPVQYVFGDGSVRLGVVTDLGCPTHHVVEKLSHCHALVVECNHDLDLLWNGSYPFALKQRVSGRFGHLDNRTAAAMVRDIERSQLRHIIAAHLSLQNNTPALAVAALAEALGCEESWIGIATQHDGFAWRDV